MAKAAKEKTAEKPKNKKDQYERFQQAVRDLGIEDADGAFEETFRRIVPPRLPKKRDDK